MLETWDWYWSRFRDNDVLQIIERRRIVPKPGGWVVINREPHPTIELPYSANEIASILKRKEKSVNRSMKRLRRSGKVEPFENGWKLK